MSASFALKARSSLSHADAITGIATVPASVPCPAGVPLPQHSVPNNAFVTASADGTVRLWRLSSSSSSRQRHMFSKDMLHCIRVEAAVPLSARPGSGSVGNPSSVDGRPSTAVSSTRLSCLTVSCDGTYIAVSATDASIHVVSTRSMAVDMVSPAPAPGTSVRCMEFGHKHAGLLFVGYRDQYIRVFDCTNGSSAPTLLQAVLVHSAPLSCLRLSVDDSQLFSCDTDANMVVSNVSPPTKTSCAVRKHQACIGLDGTGLDAAMDRTGRTVVTVGDNRGATLWSLKRLAAPLRTYRFVVRRPHTCSSVRALFGDGFN